MVLAAVLLFKAGLTLELTRKENDDKVRALNLTMCDTMEVLSLCVSGTICVSQMTHISGRLKDIIEPKDPASGTTSIEERLGQRMAAIVESIKECAKVCDSYQRRNIARTHNSARLLSLLSDTIFACRSQIQSPVARIT